MTPKQREAALRLAKELRSEAKIRTRAYGIEYPLLNSAAALLRELAAEQMTITWDTQGRRLVNGQLAPEEVAKQVIAAEPVQEPLPTTTAKSHAQRLHRRMAVGQAVRAIEAAHRIGE